MASRTRVSSQVQVLISNLISGTPVRAGDRAAIANAIANAPFSDRDQTAAQWIASDPSGGLNALINQPTPWAPPAGFPPDLIRPNSLLDSATWHTAKHRFNGDFHPTTLVHEYLDDLRVASRHATQSGSVIVGIDQKSGQRAGVLVHLGHNGAPCAHVNHVPGTHLFVVMDVQRGAIITGFPVEFRTVQKGYPFWHNRVEVTL